MQIFGEEGEQVSQFLMWQSLVPIAIRRKGKSTKIFIFIE
jgi:hypothetical protein